jgi:hypothetical protein
MTIDAAIANAKQLNLELLSVNKRGGSRPVTRDLSMRREYSDAIETLLHEANAARCLRGEVLRLARMLASAVDYYAADGKP